LTENSVQADAIRVEDTSANTWQNVEYAAAHIHEALSLGLKVTAISEWFHRHTVHALKTHAAGIGDFHALGWEPECEGRAVTRRNWTAIPDGRRRIIREWEEATRRLAEGEVVALDQEAGTWR
jgi:hypothetical protein